MIFNRYGEENIEVFHTHFKVFISQKFYCFYSHWNGTFILIMKIIAIQKSL